MRKSTIAIAGVVVLLIAATGYRLLAPGSTETPPSPEPAMAQSSVPIAVLSTTIATITPTIVQFSGPGETPTAAALRFLDLDEHLFPPVAPAQARVLTEGIASSESKTRLGARAEEHQRQVLAKGDLAGLTLRIAPIVTRTRECNEETCTVDVYFLRLWSFPGQGALDDYGTAEIHLVREDNQWRLDDSSVIDGPYPAGRYSARPNLAVNARAFESTLAGFSDSEIPQ